MGTDALTPSPSLVPDIERKKFLLPQRSPCAVPFFFFPFFLFLNVFWKRACFIYSKYIPQVRNQILKGHKPVKKGTHTASHTTLEMALLR